MRGKKLVLFLTIIGINVGLTLLTIWSYNIFVEAKKIRQLPYSSSFLQAVNSSGMKGILFRFLLLQKGQKLYHATIIPWLYGNNIRISDTPWNRLILEWHITSNVPEEIAVDYISKYPLTPSSKLLSLLYQALENGDARALSLLSNLEEGAPLISEWIKNSLIPNIDSYEIESVLPILLNLKQVDAKPLLAHLIKEKLLKYINLNSALDGSPHAEDLFDWLTKEISNEKLSVEDSQPLLNFFLTLSTTKEQMGKFLLVKNGPVSKMELPNLILSPKCVEEYSLSWTCEVSEKIPTEVLREAFAQVKFNPHRFLFLYHALLHGTGEHLSDFTESIVENVLHGSDDVLRKGVLVLTIRHGYFTEEKMLLDEVFSGPIAPPFEFTGLSQFKQTQALETYERLAGHAYDDIGKRFPPFLGKRIPPEEEINLWKDFIARFPWFPATDDAYYRLAHLYWIHGNLDHAIETINSYETTEFIDNDIAPYMKLLRTFLEKEKFGLKELSETAILKVVDEISGLPWAWMARKPVLSLEAATYFIDVLLFASGDKNDQDEKHESVRPLRLILEQTRIDLDLKREGCIKAWGENEDEACSFPQSFENFPSFDRKVSKSSSLE